MGLFGLGKPKERTFTEDDGEVRWYEGKRLISIQFKGDGDYETPVVGLNFRRDEVDEVAASLAAKGAGRHQVMAQLRREPSNQYDRNAIRVVIDDHSVGYVPREYAEVISPVLDRDGRGLYLTCPAIVLTDAYGEIRYIRLDIAFDAKAKQERDAAARRLEEAGEAAQSAIATGAVTDVWSAEAKPRGEVDGESEFLASINAIVRRATGQESIPSGGVDVDVDAYLVPAASDVVVMIDDATVGRLADYVLEDARPIVAALQQQGRFARVRARVWSSGGVGSVSVDVPSASVGAPVNGPPADRHAVLPTGRMVQVTGEERHMDVLGEVLGGAQQRAVWVTVHEVEPKPGRPAAEVRINGRPVGILSAATGKEVLPLVSHLAAAGKVAAAPGFVKGSALKADVAFRCCKASEVSPGWLDVSGA